VPCLHADPKFPDAAPGKTVRLKGYVAFHEGTDVKKAAGKWNRKLAQD